MKDTLNGRAEFSMADVTTLHVKSIFEYFADLIYILNKEVHTKIKFLRSRF